jgi:hypothetical protein
MLGGGGPHPRGEETVPRPWRSDELVGLDSKRERWAVSSAQAVEENDLLVPGWLLAGPPFYAVAR